MTRRSHNDRLIECHKRCQDLKEQEEQQIEQQRPVDISLARVRRDSVEHQTPTLSEEIIDTYFGMCALGLSRLEATEQQATVVTLP